MAERNGGRSSEGMTRYPTTGEQRKGNSPRYSERYGVNRPNPYTGYLPPGAAKPGKLYHPESIDYGKVSRTVAGDIKRTTETEKSREQRQPMRTRPSGHSRKPVRTPEAEQARIREQQRLEELSRSVADETVAELLSETIGEAVAAAGGRPVSRKSGDSEHSQEPATYRMRINQAGKAEVEIKLEGEDGKLQSVWMPIELPQNVPTAQSTQAIPEQPKTAEVTETGEEFSYTPTKDFGKVGEKRKNRAKEQMEQERQRAAAAVAAIDNIASENTAEEAIEEAQEAAVEVAAPDEESITYDSPENNAYSSEQYTENSEYSDNDEYSDADEYTDDGEYSDADEYTDNGDYSDSDDYTDNGDYSDSDNYTDDSVVTYDETEDEYAEPDEAEEEYTEPDEAEEEYTEPDETEDEYTEQVEAEEEYTEPDETEDEYTEQVEAEDEYTEPDEAEDEYTEPDEAEDEYTEPDETEDEYTEPDEAEDEYAEPDEAEDEYTEQIEAEDEYAEPVEAEDEYTEQVEAEDEYTEQIEAEDEYTEPDEAEDEYTESVEAEDEYTEPDEDSQEQKKDIAESVTKNYDGVTAKSRYMLPKYSEAQTRQDDSLFVRRERTESSTAVFDLPDGVKLPAYIDDDEFLERWLNEGGDDMTSTEKRSKRRFSAILGAIVTIFALVGFVLVMRYTLNAISNIGANDDTKNMYTDIITPVVMSEVAPFETWDTIPQDKLLQSAVFDVLLGLQENSYAYDDTNKLIIPSADVQKAAKKLFGDEASMDAASFGEINSDDLYYSDTDDCFHIAATGINGPHPSIIQISKRGSNITLDVGYLEETASDDQSEYYMERSIVLTKSGDSFYISALREKKSDER